jgi:hypothetical protein
VATFSNLYFAGDAFRRAIEQRVQQAGIPSVLVTPPKPTSGTTPLVTVTLLMINEEGTHKNDPPLKNPDGTVSPPPTTLSATYVVLTEGQTSQGDLADAHQYLGEIVRSFHDAPFLDLQALGFPTTQGEGRLHVALVPMTPDLMEKVFTPLQAQHRPFALFEVWPIQLRTTLPLGEPSAVVRPGGVNLGGPTPTARPQLEQVHPRRVALDRFLRLDGTFTKPVDAVAIGARVLTGAALGAIPGIGLDRSVRVRIDPATFGTGRHRVHVLTPGNLSSNDEEILIEPATAPSIDAPDVASYAQGGPLVLTGAALALATRVFAWPDAGVSHPSDVHVFPAVAAANSVTTTFTNLTPGTYRVTAEITPGPGLPVQFTPYVLLEVTA